MMSHGIQYSFVQFGSPVLDVSSPSLPCTSSLHISRAVQKAENALAPCEPCLETTETSLYNQPWVQHKLTCKAR